MPYTLKTSQISVKDPETGEYSGVDILAEQTEQGLIAELQAEGTAQVNRINQAAADVQAAVDQAESDAATIISDTQASINTLEAQKNTIAQTVASMAELGTDATLSTPGMAADAEAVGDLSRQLSDVINNPQEIGRYLYKKNIYINTSGEEIALPGYDTYKMNVVKGDIVFLEQVSGSEQFYQGLNIGYVFHTFDGSNYGNVRQYSDMYSYVLPNTSNNRPQLMYAVAGEITAILFTVKQGNENTLRVFRNEPWQYLTDPNKIGINNTIRKMTDDNCILSKMYFREDGIQYLEAAEYRTRICRVMKNDVITVASRVPGVNYTLCYFNSRTGEYTASTDTSFTAPDNGFVNVFIYNNVDDTTGVINPADGVKIDYRNVENISERENPFDGLQAVAFGTSLTYRSQSTQGYLTYLPSLSGMLFDNQGLGSSTILEYENLPKMLPVIKNYANYASKTVVLLEGFCNDWYYNADRLGTWKDMAETTVCGCLRNAINYMLSENPNLTIFLVLDHYGKNYGDVDSSSVAVRGTGNLTQYDFYEELSKVANSLGVPVIKQYKISGISENTPQYLEDNIHPTLLGAKQSAYSIWEIMRNYFPNRIVL